MDKNHPGQDLPDKRPPDKSHKTTRTKIPVSNWERIYTVGFYLGFCTRPTKNGGVRDVRQSVTGEGGQNWPKIAWRTLWTAPKQSLLHRSRCLSVVFQIRDFSVWIGRKAVVRGRLPFPSSPTGSLDTHLPPPTVRYPAEHDGWSNCCPQCTREITKGPPMYDVHKKSRFWSLCPRASIWAT